ncbi:MAG: hypothetical protein SGI83_14850 [Bacteroidota bacterium]|nr:hypothetical protein [Bacteroidota bacterium]
MPEVIAMKKSMIILISFLLLFTRCNKESATGGPSSTGAGGSTARFTIIGNFLYVVDNTSLKAFDISNTGAAPVLKSTTNVGINIETIFPYQDKLFIGSSFAMHIFSLTDPQRPVKLAQADYIVRMSCDPVVAKDSTAYATLNSSGPCGGGGSQLVVYDIKDITKPLLKQTLPLNGPHGLGISDSALYVCDGTFGLNVYNIRNTYAPQLLRTIQGETFYDVIPYGNILICQVATGIVLYDISTRHQPVFLSRILN